MDYGRAMGLRLSSAAGRWALLATVLGSSLASLDATVVNIALPRIGRDLHTGLSGLQWTVTGYTLALAALILLGGALGDRYGRRRVFLVGVAWFATASLLCALAPTAGLPHRRPGAAGHRRRAAHPGFARADPGLIRARGPGPHDRRLVRAGRCRRGHRPVPRRLAGRGPRLALGVPAQPAVGRPGHRGHPEARTGEPRRPGHRTVRRPRRGARRARPRLHHVRADRRLGRVRGAGCGGGGRVRAGRAAFAQPDAAAVGLLVPAVHRRERGDRGRLRGAGRGLLPARAATADRGRLHTDRGRGGPAAGHHPHAAALLAGRRAGPAHRAAVADDDRRSWWRGSAPC